MRWVDHAVPAAVRHGTVALSLGCQSTGCCGIYQHVHDDNTSCRLLEDIEPYGTGVPLHWISFVCLAAVGTAFSLHVSLTLALQELEQITDPQQHAVAERSVKMRTLGTVRLIAELYKKEVVKESIVLVCVRELLDSKNAKVSPPEENLEVSGCHLLHVVFVSVGRSDCPVGVKAQLDSMTKFAVGAS